MYTLIISLISLSVADHLVYLVLHWCIFLFLVQVLHVRQMVSHLI